MNSRYITLTKTITTPTGGVFPKDIPYEVHSNGSGEDFILIDNNGLYGLFVKDIDCNYFTYYSGGGINYDVR